ncbi:hypothetical protein [Pseudobacteriovorax antillogorgiicola]|uniref:Lipoprotein n=1 Tax=Pseudobacteriovorax antillogorgiicola TaxID=1513793 RepID=A0A1Y6B5Y6_9BACT|nr:hypothetical protein [Pseudobacteriovorax antillogorgiicola]TCS59300.1 hypothetical protein EDD56_101207 [Pseudobacteriovorax antillogorgiicola]SME89606.1 hypothetical protein SAMN06296036_101279 [Pseudobacteriovorax antillogorgiicola]
MKSGLFFKFLYLGMSLSLISCQTTVTMDVVRDGVQLPYIKNTANECYYLDEFMPIPDNLVSGRSGKLRLRYYTYKSALYKDYKNKHIILSFYSTDEQCWSLFEEYYVTD